jgi:hypothetical protein
MSDAWRSSHLGAGKLQLIQYVEQVSDPTVAIVAPSIVVKAECSMLLQIRSAKRFPYGYSLVGRSGRAL